MARDKSHVEMREKVKALVEEDFSDETISKTLGLQIGTRYLRGTVKWYKFCVVAKQNQKKAFEKHGYKLYSKAGKIAQKKHPWIGHELGKKYGVLAAKERIKKLRESGNIHEYFSKLAKKLQEKCPEHSRQNMKKAIAKMKREGTFLQNSMKGAVRCMELYPNHFKEMGEKAHKLYPDLAYTSRLIRRQNAPYIFMGCRFDSNQEREICKMLIKEGLISKPIEGENVHFKINSCDIDFFVQQKLFLEFHPPIRYNRNKSETEEEYYLRRRVLLDRGGYKDFPLLVIADFEKAQLQMGAITRLLKE